MRPTLQYFIEKFEFYNQLCFGGKLTIPPIRLNTRKAIMGVTKGQCHIDERGNGHWENISIEISVRMDLPEYEYIDTLVHEMIHYYIMSNNMTDDSPHGSLFRAKMEEITRKHGIRITIAFEPSEEELVKTKTRYRYVCVAEDVDGQMYFAVVARNKVFDFWEMLPQIERMKEVHWYLSDRAIFDKFPVAVSPRLMLIDADKIHHYLTGAMELENTGDVIKVKGV